MERQSRSTDGQAPQTALPKASKLATIAEEHGGTAKNFQPNHGYPHHASQMIAPQVHQLVEEAVAEPWVDRFAENLRGGELKDYDFPQRLAILGDAHLFFKRLPKERIWDIQLGTLQRMVIHDLQRQLVTLVGRIHATQLANEAKMNEATMLLDKYCQYFSAWNLVYSFHAGRISTAAGAQLIDFAPASAIRNYDLINEKNTLSRDTGTRDPFLITAEDRTGWLLMKDANLFNQACEAHRHRSPSYKDRSADYEKRINPSRDWTVDCERNLLPEDARSERSALVELRVFLDRMILGVFGGLAIIVPMLIMALSHSLRTSLVVTSVATIVFAVVLALPVFGRTLDGPTVLAAVAAYAAILVVFVGTSLAT